MTTTTRLRLRRKIEKLNNQLLSLGAMIEESVQLAVKSLEKKDAGLAARCDRRRSGNR